MRSRFRLSAILTIGTAAPIPCSGQTAEFAWENMARMDRLPNMVVLYMDRVHAYLLPKRVMEGQEEAFYELARKHLPKERRRRI